MTRNVQTRSIVISVRKIGENNGIVTILSRDYGVIYATLYGGPRSKLRGRVSQWNSGVMHLYCAHARNVENKVKIVDFDVSNFHLSFRECIYKDFAASVAAETAVATRCAGATAECFTLVSAFLDGLEITTQEYAQKASLIRFLWRYLSLLGLRGDAAVCSKCGGNTAQGAIYSEADGGFMCLRCSNAIKMAEYEADFSASFSNIGAELSPEAVRYLIAVSHEPPALSRSIVLSEETLVELRVFIFSLLQKAVGHPLKSIKSGVGIL